MAVENMGVAVTCTYDGSAAIGELQGAGANEAPGFTTEAKGETGVVVAMTQGDHRAAFTLEWIPEDAATFPPKNAIVQIAGFHNSSFNGPYRVTGRGERQENTGYPSMTLSCVRYTDGAIPLSTTTTTTTV